MKIYSKEGGYLTPEISEYRCCVESGFVLSDPSGFNDLEFEGREDE